MLGLEASCVASVSRYMLVHECACMDIAYSDVCPSCQTSIHALFCFFFYYFFFQDRSGILKSVRGPGIPQLGGAPPGLIHHPPYPLPSDNPHTLSLHPSHLAYPMMRPALGMGGPLPMSAGIPTKSRGNPSISNDLGPPIFMPCKSL